MPNKFSSAYTSGTECRIDPGCKFEFVCCLKVYKKIGHTVAVVRASSIEGRLPSNVVFHQMSSSIEGRLPSKVVFLPRSSSIEGCLPSKVVFHRRSSFIKGCLSSKVVFHRRVSSSPELPLNYPKSESSKISLVIKTK